MAAPGSGQPRQAYTTSSSSMQRTSLGISSASSALSQLNLCVQGLLRSSTLTEMVGDSEILSMQELLMAPILTDDDVILVVFLSPLQVYSHFAIPKAGMQSI